MTKRNHIAFITVLTLLMFFLFGLVGWWGWDLLTKTITVIDLQLASGNLSIESATASRSKVYWMIASEGATILVVLCAGFSALLVLYRRSQARAEELKSLFALWSHECKTPIANIQLQAETLLLDTGMPAGQRKFLERITQDCTRLLSFVERILEIVRTQTSPRLHLEVGCLETDLQRWWTTEGSARYSPQIEWNVTSSQPIWVMREQQAFFNVLNNVVENALKHGDGKKVNVEITDSTQSAIVRVKNQTGRFPEEELSKIGTLFFRGSNAKKSGTGVGLYLVRRLMKRMGGHVRFFNEQQSAVVELLFAKQPVKDLLS